MNTTQIAGRVGAEPDVRFTEKGLAIVRFPVAVNAGYKVCFRMDFTTPGDTSFFP